MSESKSEVVISHPSLFAEKVSQFKRAGLSRIHIVSDFDRTVTRAYVNGRRVESSYALIRNHQDILNPISKVKYISEFADIEAYAIQCGEQPLSVDNIPYGIVAKRMWNYYYHKYEANHDEDFQVRFDKMVEWWTKHFELMAYCGLTKQHLDELVKINTKIFRDDVISVLELCAKNGVPFLFFSAGIKYFIDAFLTEHGADTPNMHVVSNDYAFDEKGRVLGPKGEMIHVFSKGHVDLSHFAYVEIVKNHKYVIVLGDSLADIDMIANIPHECAIKIGFLNDEVDVNIERYKSVYDVIITNDGPFTYVKELLESLKL